MYLLVLALAFLNILSSQTQVSEVNIDNRSIPDIFELIIRSDESNISEISSLVRENPEVLGYEDAFGNTLIPLLVKNRAPVSYVSRLINLGAFKDQTDINYFTPLHYAVQNSDLPMVRYLLSIDVALNNRANLRNLRNTPLHIAAATNNADGLEILRLLIHNGAMCNDLNTELDSPLHLAIINNRIEHVDILIAAGARLNSANISGHTPLHSAIFTDNPEIVDHLLIAGADPNRTDNFFNSPLYEAAESLGANTLTIINRLLAAGARTDLINGNGENFFETLLHFNSRLTNLVQVRPSLNVVEEQPVVNRPLMQIDSSLPGLPVISFENRGSIFSRPNLRTLALSARALNILFQSQERNRQVSEFEIGSIANIEELNSYVTEQVTLLNEDPLAIIENIRARFDQEIASGRRYLTRQEILNWIHAFYGARNSATLVPQETQQDKLATEIRTDSRPLFVQRRTAIATKRLADGSAVTKTELDILESYKHWHRRNMSNQDFRKYLSQGDKLICPFDDEAEPCLIPSNIALEFISTQIAGFTKNDLQPEDNVSLEKDYVESKALVNIIERLEKTSQVESLGKTELKPSAGGGSQRNKRRRLE